MLHDPELVKVTVFPLPPPVAATVKAVLKAALDGALVVNVMACAAWVALTVWVTFGAAE